MNCCCASLAASCCLGDALSVSRHSSKEGRIPEKRHDAFSFRWQENDSHINDKKDTVKAENPTYFSGQTTTQTITEFLAGVCISGFWVMKDKLYRSPGLDTDGAMSSGESET